MLIGQTCSLTIPASNSQEMGRARPAIFLVQRDLRIALNHGGCAMAMQNVLIAATNLLHYVVKLANNDN